MAFSFGISNLEFQTPSWEGTKGARCHGHKLQISWGWEPMCLNYLVELDEKHWLQCDSETNGMDKHGASLFRTCFLWIMVDLRRKWLLMMFQYSLPSEHLNTIRTRCLKNEAICICFDNVVSIRSLVHRLHGLTHHLMIADLWETWFNKLHLLCWTCRQRHWLP